MTFESGKGISLGQPAAGLYLGYKIATPSRRSRAFCQTLDSCLNRQGTGDLGIRAGESEAAAEAALPTVQGIWAKFPHDLEAMPSPEGFDAIVNETNS